MPMGIGTAELVPSRSMLQGTQSALSVASNMSMRELPLVVRKYISSRDRRLFPACLVAASEIFAF